MKTKFLFCPKCGSIIIPKIRTGETKSSCGCGFICSSESALMLTEKVKTQNSIPAIPDIEKLNIKTTGELSCPKCKNRMIQIYDALVHRPIRKDIYKFECPSCGHTKPLKSFF